MEGDRVFKVDRRHAGLALTAKYPLSDLVIERLDRCQADRMSKSSHFALPVRKVTISCGGRRVSVEPRTPVLTYGRD